jgi:hypothetical protein
MLSWVDVSRPRHEQRMKVPLIKIGPLALIAMLAVAGTGCGIQQPIHDSTAVQPEIVRPLPFHVRLLEGNPDELPPAMAMALSNDAAVTFSYREELTHDEYHIPLYVSAFDPVTYFGAPLGDFGVTASASLSIFKGDTPLGDYTAKAHVSKSYSLYAEPTHRELEQAARTEVRSRIDEKLYRDMDRLRQAAASAQASAPAEPGR